MSTNQSFSMSSPYIATKGVVSRRNQDGTVILMKLDEANVFFKIEGLAAGVWAELETAKTGDQLLKYFSGLAPQFADKLQADVTSFLAQLFEKALITSAPQAVAEFRPVPFFKAEGEGYQFGGLKQYNLDQIESEILNESVYLDVFAGSDFNLKQDIQPLENALNKVLQLNGVTYHWNNDVAQGSDTALHAGLIAQDVAAVMPELVRRDQEKGFLAVEYSKLNSYLVEAIKELHGVVAEQNKKIKKLEELVMSSSKNLSDSGKI
ncbi:MAG: tail fiber domain-containing protein [Bdellovibrio sp.]